MLDNTGEQTGRKRRPVESPPGRQARPPPALEIATAATTTTIAAASVPPSARSRRRATAALDSRFNWPGQSCITSGRWRALTRPGRSANLQRRFDRPEPPR